jgi:hypothetical protein
MSINTLNRATVLSLADLFPSWNAQDTKAVPLSLLLQFLQANLVVNPVVAQQYAAPNATGFTVALVATPNAAGVTPDLWLLLTPTATFAAGTITLPLNPVNKQRVQVNCTQIVTALTVNGNGKSVNGAPTTLAANAFFVLQFDSTLNAWYRVG